MIRMKDTLWTGTVAGFVSPLLAYLLTQYTTLQGQLFSDKPAGFYILAAGINMVVCWVCYKKDRSATGNGFILATFLAMVTLVVTKSIAIDL